MADDQEGSTPMTMPPPTAPALAEAEVETAAQQPEVETAAQQMSEMDMEDQDDSSDEAAQEAPPDGTAAGVSPVLVMFRQSGVMILQSVVSGQALCITDGELSAKGNRDEHSQFIVHLRPSGKVALQNVANRDCWLGIYEGTALGTGRGGPFAEFNIHEIEYKYVVLESAYYQGQYVGVLEDGQILPPAETNATERSSRFIPFPFADSLQALSAEPEKEELPPPYPGPPQDIVMTGANPTAPPVLPPYEPPTTYTPYPAQGPPGSTFMPHPPQGSPATPHYPQGPYAGRQEAGPTLAPPPLGPTPIQPTTPVGYEIMDLFNKYNTLSFIPRVDTEHPMSLSFGLHQHARFKTGGSFTNTSSEFLPAPIPGGAVALRNPSNHKALFVTGDKKLYFEQDVTEYEMGYQFIVRGIHEAIVAFESAKFPGHFVTIAKNGVAMLEREEPKSYFVQFTVYARRFKGPYSRILSSPFSPTPSIVDKLKDMCVIQLYYKQTGMYLSARSNVVSSGAEDDETFLLYRDRGMGRVSLCTYFGKKFLRIERNGRIKLDFNRKHADFTVKECPDRTLNFESVSFPGYFLHFIQGRKQNRTMITNFSVYLLNRDKTQGSRGCKTILKYVL